MKGKMRKEKVLIPLVALFSALACTSVGFAIWTETGNVSATKNGTMLTDDYIATTGGDAYCISNLTINTIGYAQGYGFVDQSTGRYVSSVALTGTFDFDVSEARDSIDSLVGSRQFSLKLAFTASATTNFTYNNISFTGFSNTPVSKSVTNTATATAAYNITLTDAEYNADTISCGFSITMTYDQSLSSFPSLSSATYAVAITPDEVIS